jgi:hypothetical protein
MCQTFLELKVIHSSQQYQKIVNNSHRNTDKECSYKANNCLIEI